MSSPAFYLEPGKWGSPLVLEGAEAEHAHVLRLKEGDEILLLDGEGTWASCQIAEARKKSLILHLIERHFTPRPQSEAIVALALSKATRRGFFFEKAAELGAFAIWLWQGAHSQGRLLPGMASACRRQLIAGIKQCRNPWLPALRLLEGVDSLVAEAACADWRMLPWEYQQGVPMLLPADLGRRGLTVYVIGPEGGFAQTELQKLRGAGFETVSLGHRILRCETAATLCLGLHWWASQLPDHPDFRAVSDA